VSALIKSLKDKHKLLEELAFFLRKFQYAFIRLNFIDGTKTTSMIIMELQDLMNKLKDFNFIAMTFPEATLDVSK